MLFALGLGRGEGGEGGEERGCITEPAGAGVRSDGGVVLICRRSPLLIG